MLVTVLPLNHIQPPVKTVHTRTHTPSSRSLLIPSRLIHLPNGLLPSCYQTKLFCVFLITPIRVTFPAHLIILAIIIPTNAANSTDYEAPLYDTLLTLLLPPPPNRPPVIRPNYSHSLSTLGPNTPFAGTIPAVTVNVNWLHCGTRQRYCW